MTEEGKLAVGRTIGMKIRDASYLQYYFNSVPEDVGVGSVELSFEGGYTLSGCGLSHGESVSAAAEVLEVTPEFSLEGGICSWRKEPLQDLLNAPWLIGAKVVSAKAAINQPSRQTLRCIGWLLELENGHSFCFVNDCDEERALSGSFVVCQASQS